MNDSLAAEILASVNQMRTELNAHMALEGREMKDLKQELTEHRIASEKRHAELIRSIDAWTQKVDCSEAFLRTADGKLDLSGHNADHKSRAEFGKIKSKVGYEVVVNTLKVLTAGVVTWLLYVIWEAFLKGPK